MNPSYTIGVLTSSTEGQYYGAILAGIHRFLTQAGCRMVIIQTPVTRKKNGQLAYASWREPLGWDHIDGWLIIHLAVDDAYAQQLIDSGKPLVLLHARGRDLGCQVVDIDNVGGCELATRHLIELGHERIGFIGATEREVIKRRFQGYRQALESAGIMFDPQRVISVEDNLYASARQTVAALDTSNLPFTAVVAATDRNAHGMIHALQDAGLRIPEDVAVIGFDNLDSAAESTPPLSSIEVPNEEVGYVGAEELLRLLEGGELNGQRIKLLPATLIPRRSSGAELAASAQLSRTKTFTRYAISQYYEEALINSHEIAMSLIHHGPQDGHPLDWLSWTSFEWGCLGLWTSDAKSSLRIAHVYDPSRSDTAAAGDVYPVRQFPPLLGQHDSGGDVIRIYPVLSTGREWGVLVLRGPVDDTSFYYGETVHKQWAALLGVVLDRGASEERISRMAHHDVVTGLPNRAFFYERLPGFMERERKNGKICGLMLLDLDNFKIVNDTLGHAAGDKLLQQVAGRIVDYVQDRGIVARLGGDEFAIAYTGQLDKTSMAQLAADLLQTLCRSYHVEGRELFISASMGISRYPFDGITADILMKRADTAMYRAKYMGKNRAELYSIGMTAPLHERLYVENNLRRAIELNELELYYQPQIEVESGRLYGVEALMRWNSPVRGVISPADFIPVAEETGLIVPMGRWLLQEAAARLAQWHGNGYTELSMSINISAREFQQSGFVSHVLKTLKETGIRPDKFCLEITETTAMFDLNYSIEQLKRLMGGGVKIAMDDFGIGFSSLSVLKQLPLQLIKIDKSFIHGLSLSDNDASIVSAIIAMSHSLKLEVLAEGVETERQASYLRRMGCDYAQGYCWGRPMTAAQMTEFLGRADTSRG